MECFKELLRRSNMTLLSRFKGTIWGWVLLVVAPALTIQIIMGSLKMKLLLQELMEFPHLPPVGIISKSGMVHFGGRV